MNLSRHHCSSLAIALAVSISGGASSSELADVSGLIGGLERGCQPTEPLKAFRSDLNARYTFEVGPNRLQTKVRIPVQFSTAIGHARAFNRGEYTEVIVPLTGAYRGLRTRFLSFKIGHSNGINVTALMFDSARSEVEKVIGPDVAETQKKFETDPEDRDFGFSVHIGDAPHGSVLICDIST